MNILTVTQCYGSISNASHVEYANPVHPHAKPPGNGYEDVVGRTVDVLVAVEGSLETGLTFMGP